MWCSNASIFSQPLKAEKSTINLIFPCRARIESTCGVISRKSSAFNFSGAVTLTTFPETTAILIIVILRQGDDGSECAGDLLLQRGVFQLGFMYARRPGSAGEETLTSAAAQRETSLGALRISVSLCARALHVILQIHRSIDGY
jgi:hypothetical protein